MKYLYRNKDGEEREFEFEFATDKPREFEDADGVFWTRSYTALGVLFKGNGFYSTDNRKKS